MKKKAVKKVAKKAVKKAAVKKKPVPRVAKPKAQEKPAEAQENLSKEELEKRHKVLSKKFEYLKVNLTTSDNTDNGEGIWALPLTEEDDKLARGDTKGEKFKVILCNQPFYWVDFNWGEVVVATTNGEMRPVARLSDNTRQSKSGAKKGEKETKKAIFGR
jgi:hypothetical protein